MADITVVGHGHPLTIACESRHCQLMEMATFCISNVDSQLSDAATAVSDGCSRWWTATLNVAARRRTLSTRSCWFVECLRKNEREHSPAIRPRVRLHAALYTDHFSGARRTTCVSVWPDNSFCWTKWPLARWFISWPYLAVTVRGHRMKKYSFSANDARYKVSIHSESPEGSTKQAHNSDIAQSIGCLSSAEVVGETSTEGFLVSQCIDTLCHCLNTNSQ